MASTVCQKLLQSIHKVKYSGIMFDSTPDQVYQEQMAQTVHSVDTDFQKKTIHVKQSFLWFIKLKQMDAESNVEEIVEQMAKDKMPLEDFQSQCYDNATGKASYKSDVQQRIIVKKIANLFLWTVIIILSIWLECMLLPMMHWWWLFLVLLSHFIHSFHILLPIGKSWKMSYQ